MSWQMELLFFSRFQPRNREERPRNRDERPRNREERPRNRDEWPRNREESPVLSKSMLVVLQYL